MGLDGNLKSTPSADLFLKLFLKLRHLIFLPYLREYTFQLFMENNFIQIVAVVGLGIAYQVNLIFSTLIDFCGIIPPIA